MTAWAAPTIEAEGFGRLVQCEPILGDFEDNEHGGDPPRPIVTLASRVVGEVGRLAPIIVRYCRGDSANAHALAKSIRAAGYVNVRMLRTKR